MEASNNSIQVALAGDAAVIRVQGRGNYALSSAIKGFALAMMERGTRRIIFDMSQCIGLDSTFMGIMAGLAIRLRNLEPPGMMIAANLSRKTAQLLRTLGLDRLVSPHLAGETPQDILDLVRECESFEKLPEKKETPGEAARTVLQAHEDLSAADPGNVSKFKDVLLFLREDVDKKGG